jgi:hypothetical protein
MTSWRVTSSKLAAVALVAWLACLTPASAAPPTPASETASVAVQRFSLPATGLPDEAAMMIVGVALFGLAAAVRRAV